MISLPRSLVPDHRANVTAAILQNHEMVRIPRTPQRLSMVITKLVIQEFLVVAGSASLASGIYHQLALLERPSSHVYITAGLFLAPQGESLGLGFGHPKKIQSQPWHPFFWIGVRALPLPFSV